MRLLLAHSAIPFSQLLHLDGHGVWAVVVDVWATKMTTAVTRMWKTRAGILGLGVMLLDAMIALKEQ